jgi:hypothetical protein
VDVWSSPFTWGGGPLPKDGDFVVISKGQNILLDVDSPKLKIVLINGRRKEINVKVNIKMTRQNSKSFSPDVDKNKKLSTYIQTCTNLTTL